MTPAQAPIQQPAVDDRSYFTFGWIQWFAQLFQFLSGLGFVNISVTLTGATSGSATVTNQPWITPTSVITATVNPPSSMSASTFLALAPRAVVTNVTSGGCTVTVQTASSTTNTFTVALMGHS